MSSAGFTGAQERYAMHAAARAPRVWLRARRARAHVWFDDTMVAMSLRQHGHVALYTALLFPSYYPPLLPAAAILPK